MEGRTDIDQGTTQLGRVSALDPSRESKYSRALTGQAAGGQAIDRVLSSPTRPAPELVTQDSSSPRLIETGSTLFLA